MINEFIKELRSKVSAKDPCAVVKLMRTPETMFTGEYLAVIESQGDVEVYAFNPAQKSWIICYQV